MDDRKYLKDIVVGEARMPGKECIICKVTTRLAFYSFPHKDDCLIIENTQLKADYEYIYKDRAKWKDGYYQLKEKLEENQT